MNLSLSDHLSCMSFSLSFKVFVVSTLNCSGSVNSHTLLASFTKAEVVCCMHFASEIMTTWHFIEEGSEE